MCEELSLTEIFIYNNGIIELCMDSFLEERHQRSEFLFLLMVLRLDKKRLLN